MTEDPQDPNGRKKPNDSGGPKPEINAKQASSDNTPKPHVYTSSDFESSAHPEDPEEPTENALPETTSTNETINEQATDKKPPNNTETEVHFHSHSHDHDLGTWQSLEGHPLLRAMKGFIIVIAVLTVFGVIYLWPDGQGQAQARQTSDDFFFGYELIDAEISAVNEATCSQNLPGDLTLCKTIFAKLTEGEDIGLEVNIGEIEVEFLTINFLVGDKIIVGHQTDGETYVFEDRQRTTPLLWLAILFVIVVLALSRLKGVFALIGLALNVVVLVGFIAPSIVDGNHPVFVAMVSASLMAFLGLYITHGYNPTTTVALAGTLAALLVNLLVAWVFIEWTNMSGLATHESRDLSTIVDGINLSGLLLAGAVIGTLGALDDVTIAQVATIAELNHRNDKLTVRELFNSGLRVGREHIASTVNTLLLAYAGVGLPLILLFFTSNRSMTQVANSEIVAIEIVRTLSGSIGLVSAVPLTTFMAALLIGKKTNSKNQSEPQIEPLSAK